MDMELNEFVAETLKQIIAGVHAASAAASKHGAKINPGNLQNTVNLPVIQDPESGVILQNVEFDVAITVDEAAKTNAQIKVLGIFNLGAEGQSSTVDRSVNRVRFSVPVSFPVSK